MPFRSQLPLTASPRSAADARGWVRTIMHKLDRSDLVECAELGVSELVTNAVLHATEPISVRVRGTATHPRVEVLDGSVDPPLPPPPGATFDFAAELGLDDLDSMDIEDPEGNDDELVTFGRGLGLVARSALAYGATIEHHGKIVWFEPAPDMREDGGTDWVIDEPDPPDAEPVSESAVDVRLVGFDLQMFSRLERKYAELRRELRLLSLSHEDTYPLAADLTAMFANFDRQFPPDYRAQVRDGLRAGRRTMDVSVRLEPEVATIFSTMREMFELADAFCRAERLLSIERTPAQRIFQTWMLGEVISQLDGNRPTPWRGARAQRAHSSDGDHPTHGHRRENRGRSAHDGGGAGSSSQVS